MRQTWEMPGGVHPPENKTQSLQYCIGTLPLPERLVIPLDQHTGAPAKLIVSVNDRVLKGQMLAKPSEAVSASVHAPTSGVITAIDDQPVPHPSGMTSRCITLKPDGKDTWSERQKIDNYRDASPAELLEIIRNAGIVGMGGAGFPTAVKLQPRNPIDTLIINATECEPYITADDILIQERPEEIVEGIQILTHILGNPEQVLIGIEDNKPKAFEALEPLLAGTNIELVDFHTRYPSGGEKQLIFILTGKEVPSDGLPADIGIVCQNIGTAHAVFRAVAQGIPLISRITTVVGEALATSRNYELLIGTPISYALQHNGFNESDCARLVMGGPMMGFTLQDPDVPVIKTTNCILAPSHAEAPRQPPAQACIRCGMCAEACPASLLPQQLFWYAQSQNYERLEAHSLFDCIECGACSYVCPSNIPLVQYYRAAKGEIRKLQAEHLKSDRARERFEYQKRRKEKAEAEKAAKREARRKAAEQAKARAASGAETAAPKQAGAADDLIKAAMARAAQRQSKPEEQIERQQRALASAEERVARAQQKLADAEASGTDQQIDQARAGLADTRHRLSEANRKLSELQAAEQSQSITEKINASPKALLEKKIAAITQRMATAEDKIAGTEDPAVKQALRDGLAKQQRKLEEVRQQLAESTDAAPVDKDGAEDAAAQAIARAREKAAAMADMSEEQKLRETVNSLKGRLQKAEQRLADAEQNGSEHIDALRSGAEKLRDKLAEAAAKLEEHS